MSKSFKNLRDKLMVIYAMAMQGFDFKGFGLDTEFTIEERNKILTDPLSFQLHMLLLKAICLGIEDEMFPIIFNCKLADMREYMTLMQMKSNDFDINDIFDELDDQSITPDNETGIRDYFLNTYTSTVNEDVEYLEENNLDLNNLDDLDEYQYKLVFKIIDRNTSITMHNDPMWTWTWLWLDTFSILFDESFNTLNPFILKEYASEAINLIRQIIDILKSIGYDIVTNTKLLWVDKSTVNCKINTVVECTIPVKGINMMEECEEYDFNSTYTYNFNTPIIIRS